MDFISENLTQNKKNLRGVGCIGGFKAKSLKSAKIGVNSTPADPKKTAPTILKYPFSLGF
jgi:hypothetical protein